MPNVAENSQSACSQNLEQSHLFGRHAASAVIRNRYNNTLLYYYKWLLAYILNTWLCVGCIASAKYYAEHRVLTDFLSRIDK